METLARIVSLKTAKNRWINIRILLIAGIIALAAFLRLYRIEEYMTFLGDEGRDALVVYGILHGDLTLLGPRSSAADFYYGPIYYYLIAPFLWFFNYNPVGPAVFVALIGVATVFLLYKVGKDFFGTTAGLVAAFLYAVSPLIIAYSRSSWNPNPLPFISLSCLYFLYKGVSAKRTMFFIFAGILLGIAMQLQYLATFLVLIVTAYILLASFLEHKKILFTMVLKRYIYLACGFVIGFSPFLGFEIMHGFPNTRTIINFVSGKIPQEAAGNNVGIIEQTSDIFFRLFARLVTKFPPPEQINLAENIELRLWQIFTLALLVASIYYLFKSKNKLQMLLLALWLFLGVLLFGFYKRDIYDYYLGFMFPLPFLLVGNSLSSLWKGHLAQKALAVSAFVFLAGINLSSMPFRSAPNRQLEQVRSISEFVLSKTDGKPFNFALLTRGNSDHGYRYFFTLVGKEPISIENSQVDPERKTVTDQLLIVCEDPQCQPLGDPLWEVAGFGRAEIVGQWPVSVVMLYKLKHYQEVLSP